MIAFSILFFYVTLLPGFQLVHADGAIMAERFLYRPVFAIALLAGVLWSAIPTLRIQRLTAAGVTGTAILLAFPTITSGETTSLFTAIWFTYIQKHDGTARVRYGAVG